MPIYKEFHKNVIGKGGSNIRKIREETTTRIDLPPEGSDSDMIVITGRKDDVEKARDRILKIQSELVRYYISDNCCPSLLSCFVSGEHHIRRTTNSGQISPVFYWSWR